MRSLVFLPLVLAYATALYWCYELWMLDGSYFAHGPLVPIVMAVVIYQRRSEWSRRQPAVDLRGWWLLGPALLMHLAGAALTIDSLSAASLVLAVPGAAWLLMGTERLRGLWPALWLVALAVPLPLYVTGNLAFELKELAVSGGVWLSQATGLAVERQGARLMVPGQQIGLDVADPCGGLRSLLSMITLAYCLAFFMGGRSWLRRGALLLAAAPMALFVNVVRISAICWLARYQGVEFASGTGHDLLNAAAWVLDLALLLLLDGLVSKIRGSGGVAELAAPDVVSDGWRPRRHVVALWIVCLPLLWLSTYRPVAESAGLADGLPERAGDFVQQSAQRLDGADYRRLLGTEDGTWRVYQQGDGPPVWVVAVFHGTNWKSIHPPHVCLLGSNMEIVEDGEFAWRETGTHGRILLRTKDQGRPYLSLFAYGAEDLRTGSYLSFFLHHAPRALFRVGNSGFLLRVETYADGPGGVGAAEARCRALLDALFEDAWSLLK